ncbi:hypothetical protein QJQ45_020210 [Haematococcus lacustris]|nr:hypothetical protein QJQ45_020210 [Haematococcus lacustris]
MYLLAVLHGPALLSTSPKGPRQGSPAQPSHCALPHTDVVLHCYLQTLNVTKQRLQEVQEENAREKQDWQQQELDWQQQHHDLQHRQQDWQQQHQDWQQRQQDWQQQPISVVAIDAASAAAHAAQPSNSTVVIPSMRSVRAHRQAGSCIGSQAAMAAIRQQKYNGKNTDTYVVMLKVQARKFTATWAFEFVEGIAKAFCKRCPPLATTMGGKRPSKKKRQQLQKLNASPKAGFKCCPSGLKAQIKKAQNDAMVLRAQVEQLHQQLSDAVADYQLLQADMEQVQAARQELQGEYEALDQLAEERNHAIQPQTAAKRKRAAHVSIGSEEQAYGDRLVRDPVQCSGAPTSTQRQERSIALICALKQGSPAQPSHCALPHTDVVLHCYLQTLNVTKQRLQEVQEENAREKQDWQQQELDWQQQHHDLQHRQQDWQQQHQDWQQRQQDWQQQQQLLEKQLHDLLQRADIHAHIIVVSAANELARTEHKCRLDVIM